MPTDTPIARRSRTDAARTWVLGILALVVVAAACSSSPSPAPTDSGGDRFDIDADTTWRAVFDTLADGEQACIREDIDEEALESVLDMTVVPEDEDADQFAQSMFSCVEPETAREFFISALVADTSAWAAEEGTSADSSEETRRACLRRRLADVDLAAWLSETESAEMTSEDGELLAGLFACGLDLEMDWTFSGSESECECKMINGTCDVSHCEVTVTTSPAAVSSDPEDAGFDDHADELDWATYAEVGETVQGVMDHEGDIDYFVFSAFEGENLEIDVELGTLADSTATLYDDSSFELAYNDDYSDNGDTTASRIHWQAEYTGDHFVAVEGFGGSTGTYTLTVTSDGAGFDTGFDDHADELDWATYAEVGEAVQGVMDHEGDIDYFVFSAFEGEDLEIDVELGTLPDSTATLYDDSSFELAYNDDYSDNGDTTASRIHWQAEYNGDHFVAVEGFGGSTGTYTLTVTSDGTGFDAGFDDHADVLDRATYVEIDEDAPGAIDHGGDVDYFVFWAVLGESYQIDVELGTLADSTATLYNDGPFELAYNDDYSDNGDTTASRIHWQAEYNGVHFVAVEGFGGSTGTYTLTVTSDSHGVGSDWVTYVEIDEDAPGAIDRDDDIDYFVFWAVQGESYQIDVELGTLPDSTATLYDNGMVELAYNDDAGGTAASRIHWQAEYTGMHLVSVQGFGGSTGTYTLTIAFQ